MIYLLLFGALQLFLCLREIKEMRVRFRVLQERHDLHLKVHEEMAIEYRQISNVIPFRKMPKERG